MKFTDGKETVEVHVLDASGIEWTEDFYDDAPASDGDGVYHVPDARYPLEQAFDMLHGEGDYATAPGVGCTVEYDITDATGGTVESGVREGPDKDAECCRGCGRLLTEKTECPYGDWGWCRNCSPFANAGED